MKGVPKVRNDDPVARTFDLLELKSVDFDTLSRITTVPSFKSRDQGFSFYPANTHTHTHTS